MPRRAGLGLSLAAGLLALGATALSPRAAPGTRAELVAELAIAKTAATQGLSGLELSADGTSSRLVADRGWRLDVTIARRDEIPVALRVSAPHPLTGPDGRPLEGRAETDAEALALAPDGTLYVAFEGDHRILRWAPGAVRPEALDPPPDAAAYPENGGIEALALGPDGALYAIPERWTEDGAIPVHRHDARGWTRAASLLPQGRFHPSGADFGPDGQLYLLERAFDGPFGFRSRVRRIALGPDGATEDSVLLETGSGRHGNLEGLAVWRDKAGAIRLSLVSDDNGLAIQRNQFVEYRVVSGAAGL
ncbi:esterase-like activity of phytase family protein [Rhodovulum visakhapatnamense]|uniref:Phytase-like domain-containing protein n=1 Tax=Rhodovulum visakhapatnamense TaxID=364297 RepID=A0A4R8FQV2_9RHOB|nr:esterase-like activity of phytase family protein [Rhodovulum visakhapatnamense]TDX28905.1 hypothetical protein EV657_11099 [Rhodovulum visakhapatnamense]